MYPSFTLEIKEIIPCGLGLSGVDTNMLCGIIACRGVSTRHKLLVASLSIDTKRLASSAEKLIDSKVGMMLCC